MTLEELIYEGRIAGIPFFEILDWTTGEILEYIKVKNEQKHRELKQQSEMDWQHANVIVSMIGGKKIDYLDQYDWLLTEQEKKSMRMQRAKNKLLRKK